MSESETETYSEGEKVVIEIPARIVENYPDNSALVDADGTEILVSMDEIK